MDNKNQVIAEKKDIQPFEVTQALVGLELGRTDKSILRYLDFFTQNIPTAATYFIHVEPNFDSFNIFTGQEFTDMRVEFLKEKVDEQLKSEVEKYFSKKENMYIEYDFREGSPLEELLLSAQNLKADLVVIGQKKEEKHHGILAKKFARKVAGNALVIPEKSKAKMKNILVPVDFSENSGRALQTAVAINKQLKEPAQITVFNLYQLPSMSSYRISRSRSQFLSIVEKNVKIAAEEFLERYVPNDKSDIEFNLQHKESSRVGGYIYSYAAKKNMDFIVMGAKGHSRVELLLMGSVTEKIMNINNTIPTLIVK